MKSTRSNRAISPGKYSSNGGASGDRDAKSRPLGVCLCGRIRDCKSNEYNDINPERMLVYI